MRRPFSLRFTSMRLQLRDISLDLSEPVVMGILNVTPDSFSDGGRFNRIEAALARVREMIDEGVGIIDVGGESTRPGSPSVGQQEELDRVMPVIEAIRKISDLPISIDTTKPAVMRAACAAGAHLVNDVNGLRATGALQAVRDTGAAVCLMHMQGEPRTMQQQPHYDHVVREVTEFLEERVLACEAAGVSRECIVLDPGIGFGKNLDHNLALLGQIRQLLRLGLPVLIGVSRKSMFQQLLGRKVSERLPASLAAAALAVWQGAAIIRVHDVRATADAIRVVRAIQQSGEVI
jgi:dihydropteroate synthase